MAKTDLSAKLAFEFPHRINEPNHVTVCLVNFAGDSALVDLDLPTGSQRTPRPIGRGDHALRLQVRDTILEIEPRLLKIAIGD